MIIYTALSDIPDGSTAYLQSDGNVVVTEDADVSFRELERAESPAVDPVVAVSEWYHVNRIRG